MSKILQTLDFSTYITIAISVIGMCLMMKKIGEPYWKGVLPIFREFVMFKALDKQKAFIFWLIAVAGVIGSMVYFAFCYDDMVTLANEINKGVTNTEDIVVTPEMEALAKTSIKSLVILIVCLLIFAFAQFIYAKALAEAFSLNKWYILGLIILPSVIHLIIAISKDKKFTPPNNFSYVYK